jgi:hypothetical protein
MIISTILALIIVVILYPYIDVDIVNYDYDHVTISQHKPMCKNKKLALTTLVTIAIIAPIVFSGALFLSMATDPKTQLGYLINGDPNSCSTNTVLHCDAETNQCHIKSQTTVCGRNTTTKVYN